MVRQSQYNYEFHDVEGERYLCNGLSGTIIRNPPVQLTSSEFSSEEQTFLRLHHFILDDEVDELQLLLGRNQKMSDRTDQIELTLMLHEDCNFRCTYCFEDFTNRKLEGEVLEDLLRFVDERLPEGGTVSNHFYGGEPLMAWDSLVRINASLLEVVERKKGGYQFFITSNGSLLTPEKATYLAEHKVTHVKITLDGPAEIHDVRRVRVSGKGTFDTILKNITHALPLFKIILRVNLDASNVEHVERLLDVLAEVASDPQHLYLDYNLVHDGKTGELAPGVTYEDIYRLESTTLDRGFRLNLPPLARFRYCKFNSKNSYLVDTLGDLFLCSKSPQMQVGNLKSGLNLPAPPERSLPVINNNRTTALAFYDPKEGCLSCNLLPICGGGCTMLSLKTGKPPCPPWKDYYQEYLQIQYRNMCASTASKGV